MRWSAAFLCFVIALASGPALAQTLVYRIDRATAVVDGRFLIVHVTGAAKTGGWERPRLVERRASGANGDLEFQFVATPPEDSSAVVQQVVPVNVSLKTRAPGKSVAAVKVVSQTNTVTAQITSKELRQRTAQQ
jgi:hypothetical protein